MLFLPAFVYALSVAYNVMLMENIAKHLLLVEFLLDEELVHRN